MKIKFLWFWSILATLTVFVLVYFLQAEQDGIARLHLGAGLRININSQPSDTLKIKNVKTYLLNPANVDSAIIDVSDATTLTEVKSARLRSLKSFLPLEAKLDSMTRGLIDRDKDFYLIHKMALHLGGDLLLLRHEMHANQSEAIQRQ